MILTLLPLTLLTQNHVSSSSSGSFSAEALLLAHHPTGGIGHDDPLLQRPAPPGSQSGAFCPARSAPSRELPLPFPHQHDEMLLSWKLPFFVQI
ncbi:hypothetical protein MRB53_009328 [Persea americana]|uniref:Uncharacterized protein n=1 Tax=Persea americana TaxID=3435 RepID=A0ACC2LPV6_PERAE|nr:hypothetical protein MRB53_009328 [Persea americana]